MAVQKSRKSSSCSKKKRRYKFNTVSLTIDKYTGEKHVRHNVTKRGYYLGVKVF